jgi:DNA-binding MarR family transcriptional regulator
LLVLALAETRYHRLTVSKLCARVDAPATTALRWIKLMTEAGLLVRSDDATDKRRKYIRLSADAYARMAEYCSSSNVAALAPA